MTKEPSKDFRQAVLGVIEHAVLYGLPEEEVTTRILALCKEMLVPKEDELGTSYRCQDPETHGWNACRKDILSKINE